MTGPVVDTASAQEFMREALARITPSELDAIADELEVKHRRFRALLGPERGQPLSEEELRALLRSVFATRRRVKGLAEQVGLEPLAAAVRDLVAADGPVEQRFQDFVDPLAPVSETIRYDLASECLHYTDPARYWLWTRWVWDPATRTGALPLGTMQEFDLDGGSAGGGGSGVTGPGMPRGAVDEDGPAFGRDDDSGRRRCGYEGRLDRDRHGDRGGHRPRHEQAAV